MKKCAIHNFMVLVMILLMICVSAATASPTATLESPTSKPTAQSQEHETFDFADYCELVGISQGLLDWLDAVEEMDRDDVFQIWGLDEQVRFICAMKDAGYEIDGELYSKLMDDRLDEESRIAAAEEIVDIHYGEVRYSYLRLSYMDPLAENKSHLNRYRIFRIAYEREFPDVTYWDDGPKAGEERNAYFYWVRDISRKHAVLWDQREATSKPAIVVDEAYVLNCMKAYVNYWYYMVSQTSLDAAVVTAVFDEEYQAWYYTGTVDNVNLKSSRTQEMEAYYIRFEAVLDLSGYYRPGLSVRPSDFDWSAEPWSGIRRDPASVEYAAKMAAESIHNYTTVECRKIAFEGIVSLFKLSYKELDQYFAFSEVLFPDGDNNGQVVVLFDEFYDYTTDGMYDSGWIYGAIVNAGTGELLDCFTPAILRERSPRIDKSHPSWSIADISYKMTWCQAGPSGE